MQILFHAHTLCIPVSLHIIVDPYKSIQIRTNPCKSLQILANPLQIRTNPNKSLRVLANPLQICSSLQDAPKMSQNLEKPSKICKNLQKWYQHGRNMESKFCQNPCRNPKSRHHMKQMQCACSFSACRLKGTAQMQLCGR